MDKPLGELEQAMLLAVLRLDDEAYGLRIRDLLAARAGRRVTHGAAYATLDRLVGKGYLESRLGDSTPGRGGRRKRFFRVTAAGITALRDSRATLLALWHGLEDVLEQSQ